ncbi:MAG TPA: amino acid ABC transporter permease [Stellaceae bacterium]|nr:amino acid ABC transporter permease [Stellaceae bacterium]
MIASGHFGNYLLLLLEGAGVTLELSLGALILGSIAGVVLGAMRGSRRRVVKALAAIYIEGLRSTPFVILLFLMYYAVPVALNLDIPPYPAAITALSLHCSAYMAEVVRSGIEAVPKGQWEAAAALGLGYPRIMGLVILPQALRVMIPPTIGVYVSTLKESSLASIIGFVELLGQGMAIRESNAGGSTADVLLAVAFGYFIICFTLSRLGLRLERHTTREVREGARAGGTVSG